MALPLPLEISEAIARGATILTGNQRAARTLRRHVDLDRHAAGLTTWEPPPIFAWDTWTASLWHRLLVHGHATELLLNQAQEHTLWRAIITADPDCQSLLSPDRLAELAAQAWSRVCAHQGEARLRASAHSTDTRAFALWSSAFTTLCRTQGFLSSAQLESTLAPNAHLFHEPGGYLLVGFDHFTPARLDLLTAIRRRGVEVTELAPLAATGVHLDEAPDPQQELLVTARAIRHRLELSPLDRIALIVPDLATHRAEIDRVLRQILAPERNTITSSAPMPFEFSLGVALSTTPLVATALDLLRWANSPLPIPRIAGLLLSPYFAAARDLPARATFDASILRQHRPLRPELSLDALLRLADSTKHPVPDLAATLRTLRRAIADGAFGDTRSHADWTDTFRAFLSAAGWATNLDSTGFQALSRWENTLDQLATLDFNGVRVSYGDALASLERLAEQTLFAPETRNAPVQVMDPLEAAGSTFDALWFIGAGDATWPQRPATSPLLSWHLQRDLKMPGADADRDLAGARQTAQRIAASAPLVTFSYARELPDTHQRRSPSLSGLTLTAAESFPLSVPNPVWLEAINDTTNLPPLPDQILKGGAEILKHQAACGFRAFAEHRLFARAPEASQSGMNARDQGSVVHKILQTFWSRVQTQDALRALTAEGRRALLAEAIEAALAKQASANIGPWAAAYLDVQCERLLTMLDFWLLKELDRKIPFLVRAEELTLNDVRIGPLRLTLRVDRIDETEFGDVILDYKTGEAKPAHWLTERPDDPQLPLYAAVSTTPLAGVAFANVRAGKDMALQGYQTEADILLKASTIPAGTLEAQVDLWRDTLTALAGDFHRGDLRVRPKAYPHTCQYCKQRLLCRLDITLLQAADEDEAARELDD